MSDKQVETVVPGAAASRLLTAGYRALTFVLTAIASATIVFMMALICADIGMRFLFNAPIAGVNEIVSMLIVVCVFLQLGSTVADGRMFRADFVMRYWRRDRPALARVADASYFVLAALVLVVALGWQWSDFVHAYRQNEFVGAIGAFQITTWPFKLGAVIGCAIALLECLRIAFGAVAELRWNLAMADGSSPLLRRDLLAIATLVFAIAAFVVVILVFGSSPVRIWRLHDCPPAGKHLNWNADCFRTALSLIHWHLADTRGFFGRKELTRNNVRQRDLVLRVCSGSIVHRHGPSPGEGGGRARRLPGV